MVTTSTRTRRRFTAHQYAHMAALGIPAHDAYHYTVDEYERMIDAGLLTEYDRVELIEGEIVEMAAMGNRHIRCVSRLNGIVSDSRPLGTFVNVQSAIRLSDDSEPEPDLALVRDWDSILAKPTPADILLLIEVADSTIEEDRNQKMPRYAQAGIAEAWLVDLTTDTVERYTQPHDGQYGQKIVARPGETLASTTVPGIVIPVADVLR